MKSTNIKSALFLAVVLTLPTFAVAATVETPIEKLISELADKPEQHQAVATYYREKAAAAKKDLAEHEAMKPAYKAFSKDTTSVKMQSHCDRMIQADKTLIKEYESLAEMHEAASK